MKQLFPRALLYKEWKNARWGLVLLTLLLLFDKVLSAVSQLNFLKETAEQGSLRQAHYVYWFQSNLYVDDGIYIYVLIAMAALVYLLFYQDRQEATASLVASMPFTKEQAYNVKWLTGAGVIGGAFLTNGLILTGFYFTNRNWMLASPYRVIPTWFGLYLLYALAAFSFFMFVQSSMGHSLAATVIGPIASIVPLFVFYGLKTIAIHQFNLSYDDAVANWLSRIMNSVNWSSLISPAYVMAESSGLDLGNIHYPMYDNIPIRFLILAVITVVCAWLGRMAFRQNTVDKIGQLLMFPFLEPVFVYGFALCLGILLIVLFGLGYGQNSVLTMDLFLVGGFIGGWLIAKRVLLYYKH